jgi:DNA-nicking Smr family endonuclease
LEDSDLFRDAVRGAIPLPEPDRVSLPVPALPAFPVHPIAPDDKALLDSLSDEPPGWDEALESGEELRFLRDGLSRQVLKKLRRGHWVVQAYVDLHGMNREEARQVLGQFLAQVIQRGYRCVRIIHGKGLGSKNREPVLKAKIKTWLARHEEVLAYCEAPAQEGGAGATIVLLKA